MLLLPESTRNRLTLGILLLVVPTGDTGERRDIEVLVVVTRFRLPERQGVDLGLGDAREDQQEESSRSPGGEAPPTRHGHPSPSARLHGTNAGDGAVSDTP